MAVVIDKRSSLRELKGLHLFDSLSLSLSPSLSISVSIVPSNFQSPERSNSLARMPWKLRSSLAQCSIRRRDCLFLPLLVGHQSSRSSAVQVHAHLITSGRYRTLALDPGLWVWNAILRHYSMGSFPEEAFLLYSSGFPVEAKLAADSFTFSFLIKSCANLSLPGKGQQLHGATIKKGFHPCVYVQTALLNMYCDCGLLNDAEQLFDEMPQKNTVTWNAIITGLSRCGNLNRARELFNQMHHHHQRQHQRHHHHRNLITWTCLIDGYTRARKFHEAFSLFQQMMASGISPTEVTILAVVPSISGAGAGDLAASTHALCLKTGLLNADIRVPNCLIDMYSKCGSIESSLKSFDELPRGRRNIVSWTSIISGFAMFGMAEKVMELLEKMIEEGLNPNRVTFYSILNACSHGGMVNEGVRMFSLMGRVYGVDPDVKHFGCLIDMLGRVGRLEEAEKMILEMGFAPNSVLWRTLLNCCCIHGDVEIGERVMRRVLERGKGYAGDYVVMSNALTRVGRFWDAEEVRRMMDEREIAKIPGRSLV